ncbi:MAG: GAF domain-containing protein, partial [Wenzhouxiangellaceae bacterium]
METATNPVSGDVPDPRILEEQCRQLCGALPSILSVSTIAALLLFFVHLDLQPVALLLAWLATFLALMLTRVAHGLRFRRDRPRGAAARRWYRQYFWLTMTSALVWGSGALVFFADRHEGHLALLSFVVAGLGAGSIVNLAPRWQCAWAFVMLALLPYAARFQFAELPLSDEIALFVLVFVATLMALSRQASAGIERRIRGGLAQIDQAEESRRERQRFQSLVESTRAIMWEGEPGSNRFTYVSPEAEGLLGYPASRWVTEPGFWLDHLHPEDRDWVPEFSRHAAEEFEDHTFDYRMIAADGREVWLHAVVKVITAEGRPVKHVGVMIDISELKAAQQGQEYLAGLQRLMVRAAGDFLSSGDDDFDRILSRTLEEAGRWCDADRAYLMRFTPDLAHYSNTHEWVAAGITAEMDNLQDLSVNTIPELFSRLRRKRPAVLPDVDGLSAEWRVEKALFQEQSIQSLIVLPIFRGDMLVGLVGFDSVRSRRDWTAGEIAVLQLLANLVGAAIQHSEMERRLRASET